MSTGNKWLAVAGLAAAFAFSGMSAFAQSGVPSAVPPPLPPDQDAIWVSAGEPGPGGPPEPFVIMSFEGGYGGKTVTGAPFSATTTVQTTQVLSDGNQIQRSSNGTFARDSQGRTRRDMTPPAMGRWAGSGKPAPQVSMINDPVAGNHYILEADKKIARQFPARGAGHGGKRGGAREGKREAGPADQANVTTTSLGTQTINGVSATGTRTTRTIPAGAIGNEKPIVITSERWYSSDLQIVVMSKYSDPRTGETVMQVTNIQRSEPDASLFQVPADYTIEKGRPHGAFGPKPLPE